MATQPTAIPVGGGTGLLRVVSNAELDRRAAADEEERRKERDREAFESGLANEVRKQFEAADRHRRSEQIEDDQLHALRTIRGEYDPNKLRDIKQFDGSQVYARLTAVKCRGASALLRDIYLSPDRPWELMPTPDPNIPGGIQQDIMSLVNTEVQMLRQNGMPVDEVMVQQRVQQLQAAAKKAARKKAAEEAKLATAKLDDILIEGGFYTALAQFIRDLPIFLFACIKGPVVRKGHSMKWGPAGKPEISEEPKMFWYRVNPLDIWFAPGASDVDVGPIFERIRLTRDELYDCIGLPGYDEQAIREVLSISESAGLGRWAELFDTERAELERRENPHIDSGTFIDTLEYHGYMRGKWLRDWGMSEEEIPDEDREYYVTAWLIDNYVIKVQLNPNPRKRPIYYVTSFEKIPGSMTGNGLPNILSDLQDVANATLRALVNNLSIASGPQVVVNTDRVTSTADINSLYPWKRWFIQSDPYNNTSGSEKPIDFFQPQSNAQELLVIYEKFTQMADEVSAIPRYMTGSERVGGAASTASGLSMLMNNSSKVMQNVAANIDTDVIRPVVQQLYDMVMLTDGGQTLRGDEQIEVKGVTTAVQREQDRVRQLEFLQMTANPVDMQIVGLKGRAAVLRKVAQNLGIFDGDVIPPAEELEAMQAAQAAAAQAGGVPPGQLPGPDDKKADGAQPHLNTQGNGRSTVA